MRICHLGKYYPPAPGGIETHVQTLARAQRRLGADVRVLCMNHEPASTPPEIDQGVKVQRFASRASFMKIKWCPGLMAEIRRTEADIFHLHVPNPVMILHAVMAGLKAPLVVTYHSDVVRQRLRAMLFRPVERKMYARVRRILMTSPLYADGSQFLRHYRNRLTVLPMGLDLSSYSNPSAEHKQAAEEIARQYPQPLWLCTGRLTYYKGLDIAIRALKDVPGTLIIIGSGPEGAALSAEVRALKQESRVVFKGYLPSHLDIIPYYLAATALWFPSNARSEAFGLVQVEAMASGCPVINTDIPHSGVTWVCPDGVAGLTVRMNDSAALAAAANKLLLEDGLRSKLSAGGRKRAADEFDSAVMGQRSLRIYDSVLKNER